MKKLLILATIFMSSCIQPIMRPDEYRVVDTISAGKNGFGIIIGYDVIVEYDSSYYLGWVDYNGNLNNLKFRKLDPKNWK